MNRIRTGFTQELTVLRNSDFGVYLGFEGQEEAVLLPKKEVPEGTKAGDVIRVFIYRDSEDRLIATVKSVPAEVGGFALLNVKGVSKFGAFLDWGLSKDLFLPFKEQEQAVKSGMQQLVRVYLDRSDRLCATTRLYDHLSASPKGMFKEEDGFVGYVYRTQKDIGAFVAVVPPEKADALSFDTLYFGLIPKTQVFRNYAIGEKVTGRIVRVREDGKLDLSERARDYAQLDADGEAILKKIDEYGGTLPFSEKASPEIIKRELEMSKNGFKRALGHLLKAGKIEIGETEVRRID